MHTFYEINQHYFDFLIRQRKMFLGCIVFGNVLAGVHVRSKSWVNDISEAQKSLSSSFVPKGPLVII